MSAERIDSVIARLEAVSSEVQKRFSGLTPGQMNRKPSPESWSIAQCIDHLIVTNSSYFPQYRSLLSGQPEKNIWKSAPILPGFFGKLLIKSMRPGETKKFRTQPAFEPSESGLAEDIVSRFLDSQNELAGIFLQLKRFDLSKEKATSPAARFITYSLDDLLEITVLHEERHLKQAIRTAEQFGY